MKLKRFAVLELLSGLRSLDSFTFSNEVVEKCVSNLVALRAVAAAVWSPTAPPSCLPRRVTVSVIVVPSVGRRVLRRMAQGAAGSVAKGVSSVRAQSEHELASAAAAADTAGHAAAGSAIPSR